MSLAQATAESTSETGRGGRGIPDVRALFKNTHDVFVPRGLLEFSKRRVCIEADANQHVVRRFKLPAKIDPILPFAAWHEEDLAR